MSAFYGNLNVAELTAWLAEQAEKFKEGFDGCSRFILDDEYAIYMGWLPGYSRLDGLDGYDGERLIVDRGYGLNVGVKRRNDSYWAEYDALDSPILSDGRLLGSDYSVADGEDCGLLASTLAGDWDALREDLAGEPAEA